MFHYNLIEKPLFTINTKSIDEIMKIASNIVNKKQFGILNIVFLEANGIQNLNNKYRGIDKTTDVLSFHYFDDFSDLQDNDLAGEIIMSEEKIKIQAIEYGLGEEKEFYKLLIHSVLHILGYDHELDNEYEIMQDLEDKIWKEVFGK